MDKQLLRPRELCVEPGAPDAGRVFAFWLRTVEDFYDSLRELCKDGDPVVNRKHIIISGVFKGRRGGTCLGPPPLFGAPLEVLRA